MKCSSELLASLYPHTKIQHSPFFLLQTKTKVQFKVVTKYALQGPGMVAIIHGKILPSSALSQTIFNLICHPATLPSNLGILAASHTIRGGAGRMTRP